MVGLNAFFARRDSRPTLSLVACRPESLVWTWLAFTGLIGAVILAVLGIPPIDIHGPLHNVGIMDPFCGATRSVSLTMHGRLDSALHYNPAAPVLLVAAAGLILRTGAGWLTGRWVYLRVPRRAVILLIILAVALEVRQQANAALLTAPWTGS